MTLNWRKNIAIKLKKEQCLWNSPSLQTLNLRISIPRRLYKVDGGCEGIPLGCVTPWSTIHTFPDADTYGAKDFLERTSWKGVPRKITGFGYTGSPRILLILSLKFSNWKISWTTSHFFFNERINGRHYWLPTCSGGALHIHPGHSHVWCPVYADGPCEAPPQGFLFTRV